MNRMTVAALTTIITTITPVGARNVQKGPNSLNESAPGAQRPRAHGHYGTGSGSTVVRQANVMAHIVLDGRPAPDLHPNVRLRFLFIVSFVELLLSLWLLIRG
jgi:hypothetical protein